VTERYYEDVTVGETHSFGPREVTAEEMIAFAQRYDPQFYHTDPEAAADSAYGELIASGWFTGSVVMGMQVRGLFSELAVMGAIGVDELRWYRPVLDGDEIHLEVTVDGKDPRDGERGLVELAHEATVDGERVLTRTDLVLVEHRERG
jgi:acyl dehydratase